MVEQLLTLVSVTALVMIRPGPDMLLVLRNTLMAGRGPGVQTSVGILCGNLIHITYCLLGIGVIISQSIVAFSALKFAAAAYLVYLGIASIRSAGQVVDAAGHGGLRREKAWLMQGFLNNLLNPKGALFYLGVFTVVITPDTSAGTMFVLVSAMMLISASFWMLFVCVVDRSIVRSVMAKSHQAVARILGALFILLGIRVASMSR